MCTRIVRDVSHLTTPIRQFDIKYKVNTARSAGKIEFLAAPCIKCNSNFYSVFIQIAHTAYKNMICAYAQTLNFRMRQCINFQKKFCVSENLYAQRIKKAC